jgi:hypothetical protein
MRKVYHYGFGGWSEVLDVRDSGTFWGTVIVDKHVGDANPVAHGTPIKTNQLAFAPHNVHPVQYFVTDDGANESAEALAVLIERFPILRESRLLGSNDIVRKLRKGRELVHA